MLDMFAHWRYIFERLLGPIAAVSCRHMTAVPERRDEQGRRYPVDVEDHAFAIFELAGGGPAQIRSSWGDPGKRRDLLPNPGGGTFGWGGGGLHRSLVAP